MNTQICETSVPNGFSAMVAISSDQPVDECYTCHRCSCGCPVAGLADMTPSQLIRLIQTGYERRVLDSSFIWLCLSCETCGERCPNGIRISKVVDALKIMTASEQPAQKVAPDIRKVKLFHSLFMQQVRLFGRVQEIYLLGLYKVLSLDLFADMRTGLVALKKRKLPFKVHRIRGIGEVRNAMDSYGGDSGNDQ